MTPIRCRKSSYSGGNDQSSCVELAHDRNAIRDSKNPDGPVLAVDVRPLLADVRVGRITG